MLKPHIACAALAALTLSACPPAFAGGDELQDFYSPLALLSGAPFHPEARFELASADADLSPLLSPMLALYSQLLTLDGKGSGGVALQRLQARIGGKAAEKTGLLDINDVLAADLDSVEVIAISGDQLQSLGVAATDVGALPTLGPLTNQLKSAMMELPQGLASIEGPVALAVWGAGGLASLVIRAN